MRGTQTHGLYETGGAPMGEDFNALNFLLLNNKNQRTFSVRKSRLGACCLTILIFLILLNVLRMPPDHATPMFADLKVIVYRMKGDSLQDER